MGCSDGEAVINAKHGRTRQSRRGRSSNSPTCACSNSRRWPTCSPCRSRSPRRTLRRRVDAARRAPYRIRGALGERARRPRPGRNGNRKKKKLDPNDAVVEVDDPPGVPVDGGDLTRNIDYARPQPPGRTTSYKLAYWGRIFYPLNVLVLAFSRGAVRVGGQLRTKADSRKLCTCSSAWRSRSATTFFQKTVVSMGAVYNFNLALVKRVTPSLLLARPRRSVSLPTQRVGEVCFRGASVGRDSSTPVPAPYARPRSMNRTPCGFFLSTAFVISTRTRGVPECHRAARLSPKPGSMESNPEFCRARRSSVSTARRGAIASRPFRI